MAISRTIQNHLAKSNWDAIEDEWLSHSSEDPEDLDYFIGVARALTGSSETDRASFLLQLLDDELRQQQLWKTRLAMLRRAGHLLGDPRKVHSLILDTLEKLYGSQPSYVGLVEQLGLNRGTHDLKKSWEKVDRLEVLIHFDIGSAVLMEGKGAGEVVEVNFALESLKIDFERLKGMRVGFRAAAKLLRPLPKQHILYRKQVEPKVLKALVQDDPSELLRIVLQSYDRPLKAAEVKTDLEGIVTASQWTGWWNAARKSSQVVPQDRQAYTWADTSEDAAHVAWRRFERADGREKIELLRRDGQRDPELGRRMVQALEKLGAEVAEDDPALAFEIWCAIERAGEPPRDDTWAPEALLGPESNARKVSIEIQDRTLRERAYALLRQQREDWSQLFLEILPHEGEALLLSQLAEALLTDRPSELERFLDRVVSQPRKHPAVFSWHVERAADDEALRDRNALLLLRQFLQALDDEVFFPYRQRLRKHAETGGLLPRLLPHLNEEQAPRAAEAIERAPGLEGYQRTALMTALELRFESLRQSSEDDEPLYALADSIEAKRQEFQHLHTVELPANRKAIEEARALGDLRENFEYKSARQRHEYLSARLASLNHELSRVQPIDFASLDSREVRIGTRLRLSPSGTAGDGGARRTLTLLGPWESKPEEDVISYQSELGRALLGKVPGDVVELAGEMYEIEGVEPYVP